MLTLYLVGGAVRDMLLGRAPTDRDFVYFGGEEALLARFPRARRVGKAFAIYLYEGMEFAPPRGAAIEEDLLRRDLTVNALALREDGRLHCHPQALEDLRARILRPASATAFLQDPARVFRAAKFAARWPGFTCHPTLYKVMRETAARGLLATVDAERVGAELAHPKGGALTAAQPGRFLRVLAEGQCLAPWFDGLAAAPGIPAGPLPYHDESVLEHTAQVMDRVAAQLDMSSEALAMRSFDRVKAVWMALCHDLGKTATDPTAWPRHHGHDALGAPLAEALADTLRLPGRLRKAGAVASRRHMAGGRYHTLRPGTRVDLLTELVTAHCFEEFFAVARADAGVCLVTQTGDGAFRDPTVQARRELAAMLAVRLPDAARDLGPESGRRLRELRCQALASMQRIPAVDDGTSHSDGRNDASHSPTATS